MENHHNKTSYQVKLEAFEGPMDMLIHLIENQKLEIYDIPIVRITEQYLQYLSQMKQCNLEITGDFLVMAATLIDIKSRMLLPSIENLEEEDEDPRLSLIERLVEYKKFKRASESLKMRESTLETRFFKMRDDLSFLEDPSDKNKPMDNIAAIDLMKAWEKLLAKKNMHYDRSSAFNSVRKDPVTVEEKILELKKRLESESQILFEKVFETSVDKIQLITTFLAVLELAKNRMIIINQDQKTYSILLCLREKAITV